MLLEFFLMYSTTVGRRREKQMKGEVFFRKLQLVSTLVFFYFFYVTWVVFFFFFWIGMRGSVFFIKCEVSFGYLEEMTNEEWKVQTNLVCARGMGVFFLKEVCICLELQ